MIDGDFCSRLERALAQSGLTPAQLDHRMGWRRGWTRSLLRGEVGKPPARLVPVLADVLAVSAEWLDAGVVTEKAKVALREAEAVLAASGVSDTDRKKLLDLLETL